MRILFVLEHFHPYVGGAEELFLSLARKLVQNGHRVDVVTTLFDKRLPAKEITDGIHIERLRCGNRFLFTLQSIPAVIRKARHADIVHTTSYNAAFPAWVGAVIRGKKTVITFHEVWGRLWFELPFLNAIQRALYYTFERFILLLPFTRFVAVSAFTRKALADAGVKLARISQVYNGIDQQEQAVQSERDPGHFTFCYFGRLGVSKGLDILLPAFAMMFRHRRDVRLKLIIPKYPEPLFRYTQKIIEAEGLAGSVSLHHDLPKTELMKEVKSSDCVVIPSYSEGFCFTAVEAGVWGVPVISSGKGALQETVGGKHITFERMNPDDLYEAMQAAYSGEWKDAPAKKFTLNDCVEGYLNVYKNL
jgi:glycosyltransferase involved in cell wall biosynthesis